MHGSFLSCAGPGGGQPHADGPHLGAPQGYPTLAGFLRRAQQQVPQGCSDPWAGRVSGQRVKGTTLVLAILDRCFQARPAAVPCSRAGALPGCVQAIWLAAPEGGSSQPPAAMSMVMFGGWEGAGAGWCHAGLQLPASQEGVRELPGSCQRLRRHGAQVKGKRAMVEVYRVASLHAQETLRWQGQAGGIGSPHQSGALGTPGTLGTPRAAGALSKAPWAMGPLVGRDDIMAQARARVACSR